MACFAKRPAVNARRGKNRRATAGENTRIYRNGEPLGHHRLRDRELLGRFYHAAGADNGEQDLQIAVCVSC